MVGAVTQHMPPDPPPTEPTRAVLARMRAEITDAQRKTADYRWVAAETALALEEHRAHCKAHHVENPGAGRHNQEEVPPSE